MKQLAILVAAITFLCSCGQPIPPQPTSIPDQISFADTTSTDDSNIQTITLSTGDEDSVIAQILVTPNGISAFDSEVTFDATDPNSNVTLTIYKGTLTVHDDGPETKQFHPPCEMMSDGKVRVKEGATLTFLARYYGTTITQLLRCNPNIENRDYIQAGTILRLNCKCYECPAY